ncbi:MAG: PRC-barrel domain-containing protein [Alphaproteobacteria bacterium]
MRILLTVLAVIFCFSETAMAQGTSYMTELDRLMKVNAVQAGKHVPSKEILNGRILDSTNRVVGELRDVILDRNGAIAMLDVDFNRINLGVDSLFINYIAFGAHPATNGYKLAQTDNQIAAALPELLAATETASGSGTDIFSIKKIVGRKIYAENGKKLGKIEDVLFDSTGARAELLLVSMTQRSVRGEKLTIPFAGSSYNKKKITVKREMADAMIAYAKSK